MTKKKILKSNLLYVCCNLFSIYPPLLPWTGCDLKSIFRGVKLVWSKSFPFPILLALPGLKEPSLSNNLSVFRWKTDGFMPFLKVLSTSKILTALSRIWTQVTDFISYDDNHYAKCASFVGISPSFNSSTMGYQLKYEISTLSHTPTPTHIHIYIYIYIYIYVCMGRKWNWVEPLALNPFECVRSFRYYSKFDFE